MSMNWTKEDLERFEKVRLEREAERKAKAAAALKQWTADGWKQAQKDLSEGALLKNRRVYENLGRVWDSVYVEGRGCGKKHPKHATRWEKECEDAVDGALYWVTQDYLWRYLPRKVLLRSGWSNHTTALWVCTAAADEWEDKFVAAFVAGYLSALVDSEILDDDYDLGDAVIPAGMAEKYMDWEPYDRHL